MLILLVLGCSGTNNGTVGNTDPTDGATVDTDTTDTDTDVTDTDTTGTPGGVELTGLEWRLHAIESMVYVSWTQSATADLHVEYSFDSGVWMSTPTVTYEAGDHERIVVGIPYATQADWRLVAGDGTSVDGSQILTGILPPGLPTGAVLVSDPTRWLATGNYILTSINERQGGWTGGDYWTFIMDREARVVWAHKAPQNHWTLFAQVSVTGDHVLWDESTYWSDFDDGRDSVIHKTWLDEEFEVVPTRGLHHEFIQLPDETLVWGSQDHGGDEALVKKAPGQPDETILWTCQGDWPGSGNCESNGLFWQESTDSFLYSFYTNNSLVEVDHVTGASLWWAGDVAGGYAFVPRNSQFAWQHGVSYTSTGTLLLSSEWDGGDGGATETWLMEYEVDRVAGSLTLVWSDNSDVRAETNGQAWRLDNGNTLHLVGSASVIREVEPGGDDVWRVDFEGDDRLLGQGEYIEDLYALVKPD
jgi:hypothetical protein